MTADPHNEHNETWFGSGLRAHLGIKPIVDEPPVDVEAEAPAEARPAPAWDADADAAEARLAELAERERRLRAAEQALAEREQRVAAESEELERKRSELEARAQHLAQAEPQLPVRNTLRDRAEADTDRLWRTIDQALEATFEDGRPDFHARLAAIKLLLGEAYDDASAAEALPPRDDGQPADELAVRRAERFQL